MKLVRKTFRFLLRSNLVLRNLSPLSRVQQRRSQQLQSKNKIGQNLTKKTSMMELTSIAMVNPMKMISKMNLRNIFLRQSYPMEANLNFII